MRKINILYVVTKLELGGAQTQLLSLIRHLDQKKFNLFLYTAQEGLLLNDALAIDGLKVVQSHCLERPLRPLRDFLAFRQIRSLIRNNHIDIVHTHSSKAGVVGRWAAKSAGAKIVLHTVHGWSFNAFQSALQRKLCIWLERLCARFTDTIIVVSAHDRKTGLDNAVGRPAQYRLIRYGIDRAAFSQADPSGVKKEFGISAKDLVVGMIACFKPQKAPQDFIKLATLVHHDLPAVKFLLAGDGVLRLRIERLIKKHTLHNTVILTGWRRDIPKILASTDVCVLTSVWEGLPIAILEAMASGKPVVATDTGGIREVIIERGTGFLVPPHDMDSMAKRLISLLRDEDVRGAVGRNARAGLGVAYETATMAAATLGLYEELIARKIFQEQMI